MSRHRRDDPDDDLAEAAREAGLLVAPTTGVVVHASDGAVAALSARAARLLGRDAGRTVGRLVPDWAVLDEDVVPLAVADRPPVRAARTGEPVRGVVLGTRAIDDDPAGAHRWVEVSSVPLVAAGAVSARAVISTLEPVTGTRHLTLALREAQRMLRVLTESSTEVISWQAPDSTIIWVSPAVGTVLGRSDRELVGTRGADLAHPDDRGRVLADAASLVAGAELERSVVRVTHADGRPVWLENAGRVVAPGGGRPAYLQVASRDVTARVLAERAGAQAARLFEHAMDQAPVGMALRPVDGPISRVNRAMAELLGRPAQDLLGTYLSAITHPDDVPDGPSILAALDAGEIETHESERRYLRPDGSLLWGLRSTVVLRDDRGRPEHYLTQLQDVTARHLARDELARVAQTDPLTGLANRTLLLAELEDDLVAARALGGQVHLLFVDLDHFKAVNDVFGHAAGDAVLRETGYRLRGVVRDSDVVARMGGDEFVVLCRSAQDAAELRVVADRVRTQLARTVSADGHEVRVSASVGTTAGDGPSAGELLRRADDAMYGAKRRGRAHGVPGPDVEGLVEEVRRALQRDELRLHHQPVVDLLTERVVAREALLRWEHPTRGLLLPEAFLAVVERDPVVLDLGRWVLRAACEAAVARDDDVVVHVNVSARQLADPMFPQVVRGVLAETGLVPGALCLEVTESLAVDTSPTLLTAVHSLVDSGVGLALDDFGTGQSSITALRRLPVSVLKVDRSFVADVTTDRRAAALVAGLVQLGAGMGLTVVAEGVETAAQAAWLRAQGCPQGQGHLYGRAEASRDRHDSRP